MFIGWVSCELCPCIFDRITQMLLVYTNMAYLTVNSSRPQCGPPTLSDQENNNDQQAVISLIHILQALTYTNSSVNPILYAMLSENFKKSFAAVCCGRRNVELELPSKPEPSVYQKSRNSIRRRLKHRDEEEEDSPVEQKNDEKHEISSFLKVPLKNGAAKLSLQYRNGSTDMSAQPLTTTTDTKVFENDAAM